MTESSNSSTSESGAEPESEAAATKADPTEDEPTLEYEDTRDFVEDWLLPLIEVRITSNNREGTYTWCRKWWKHDSIAVRFAALHKAFEAASGSADGTAVSAFIVQHVDPTIRTVLDGVNGPMHRCSSTQHVDLGPLPRDPVPDGWIPTQTAGR